MAAAVGSAAYRGRRRGSNCRQPWPRYRILVLVETEMMTVACQWLPLALALDPARSATWIETGAGSGRASSVGSGVASAVASSVAGRCSPAQPLLLRLPRCCRLFGRPSVGSVGSGAGSGVASSVAGGGVGFPQGRSLQPAARPVLLRIVFLGLGNLDGPVSRVALVVQLAFGVETQDIRAGSVPR